MNPLLMKFIEMLLKFNIHFTVTSAFRTPAQNLACGGAENSQHLTGDAIDIIFSDYTPDEFISRYLYDKNSLRSLGIDQMIKYRTFIHFSFPRGRAPRQMVLDFTDRK